MNKTLLALAVAAAAVAPMTASAAASVYGIAQVEYSVTDVDGAANGSVTSLNDDAGMSRLGFKFSEKLGGGLTAFGVVEFALDPADKQVNQGQRQQYIGMKGSWGAITAGALPNIYGATGGAKFDPFNATNIQLRSAGGMSSSRNLIGHHDFNENAIGYASPKVNGFQVNFQLVTDEAGATTGQQDATNDWVVAVSYKNGPWTAGLAHGVDNNNSPTNDEKATKVALQWKNGPHTVNGQYEWLSDTVANAGASGVSNGGGNLSAINAGEDGEIWFLNYAYKAGNNTFSVAYGETDSDDEAGGTGNQTDVWRLGVIHAFSKQTRIYAGYIDSSTNDDSTNTTSTADRDAWTIGMTKKF